MSAADARSGADLRSTVLSSIRLSLQERSSWCRRVQNVNVRKMPDVERVQTSTCGRQRHSTAPGLSVTIVDARPQARNYCITAPGQATMLLPG